MGEQSPLFSSILTITWLRVCRGTKTGFHDSNEIIDLDDLLLLSKQEQKKNIVFKHEEMVTVGHTGTCRT